MLLMLTSDSLLTYDQKMLNLIFYSDWKGSANGMSFKYLLLDTPKKYVNKGSKCFSFRKKVCLLIC